jgi:hypothetical protein
VGENARRAVTETVRATSTVTSSVGEKLTGDDALESSLREAAESLRLLGAVLAMSINRQLLKMLGSRSDQASES